MAFIAQEEINHVRNSANIVDVIGSYVPLTPKGKNFFCVCPFHEDHNPSMSVSPDKQIYRCFVCGNTGNVFTFVERFLNVSFAEAVSLVAKQSGISISVDTREKSTDKMALEHEVMDLVLKIYQNNIHTYEGEQAVQYLKQRGLSEETIKEFQIGLALNKNILYDILNSKKYDSKILENLGLINQNDKECLDVFRNRILFPIHDFNGYVVGFTGRCYLADITPKYLNTKETYLFKKGKILFNYHRAKEAIRLKKQLIIVEGNMDAIRLSSVGIKNVVALMGTSLTKDQLEALKKLRVPLVLMLDNDNAGEEATYNLGSLLEEKEFDFSVVRLSKVKDPDEYVLTYGKEALEENIDKAISFIDFKLNYLKRNKNLEKASDLSEYIHSVLSNLKNSSDEILKEVTLQKLANDYNISYVVLKEQLGETQQNKIVKTVEKEKIKKRKDGYDRICEEILFYMMNGVDYIKLYQTRIGVFPVQEYRMVANEIIYYYEKNKSIQVADFISYMETNPLKELVLNIINTYDLEINEENMLQLMQMFQKKTREKEIEELKTEIKKELDVNKKMELMGRLTKLKNGSGEYENN